jgi:hypothetical protein
MDVKNLENSSIITSPKTKATYTVEKAKNGTSLWIITIDVGSLPEKLSGQYTRRSKAVDAIRHYLHNMRETSTVRRDNYSKKRMEQKAQNAAALQPEDSK